MNILFTTSPALPKSPFSMSEKRPPLGVGSLISVVRKKGHKVFFIDNYLKSSNFIESGFLKKNKINYIGIYANTICFAETLKMLSKIQYLRQKKEWQGKIIIGGPHTSVALNTIPAFVDYVVLGEGEKAILKIIGGRAKKRIIKEERMTNLDSLPFQPWDIFSKLPYDYSCLWMNVKPVFTLNTSRGCPYNCSFCSVKSIWGRQYTFFSPKRIISEIEFLIKNYNAKGIYFREDNFTANKKRVEVFCKLLLKKNIKIKWACETRVNTLTENLIKLMSQAGCRAFYLGVESGSQKVLKLLNKGINVRQIRDAVQWSKEYHINTYCSLIIGTPFDDYEDFLKTQKLMEQIKPYSYFYSIFVGIPYSNLYRYAFKNKLYEHIDELGLLYMPGFDIKSKYFYGWDSERMTDYKFKKRTELDQRLIEEFKFYKKVYILYLLKKIKFFIISFLQFINLV